MFAYRRPIKPENLLTIAAMRLPHRCPVSGASFRMNARIKWCEANLGLMLESGTESWYTWSGPLASMFMFKNESDAAMFRLRFGDGPSNS